MFDNHCSKCKCDFDVITQLKESQKMGFESKILFCPHCSSKILKLPNIINNNTSD